MKLLELINQVPWEDVEKSFIDYYGCHFQTLKKRMRKKKLSKFKFAFEKLCSIEPQDTNMRIVVYKGIEDGEIWADVSGLDGTLQKVSEDYDPATDSAYANEEVRYGLAFTSWSKWVGMEIEQKSLEAFNHSEIVAHCLWELSFNGFISE